MASPFSLSGKKKEKASGGDYNTLLKKNMARYKDRDEAVKKTNIASGYGNSTAQRFMHEGGGKAKAAPAGGGGGAGKKTDRRKTSSTKKRGNFSLPASAPIPAERPTRSPTSEPNSLTPPPGIGSGIPTPPMPPPGIGSGIPTPPMPSFSPDLAVSPQRPPDPMGAGAPQGMGMSGTGFVPPMPSALPVSPQFPQDNNMMQTAPQNGLHIGAPPRPVVGSGGPVGAGQPLISTPPADDNASWIRKLLGLA
jgi:hypothetical protein